MVTKKRILACLCAGLIVISMLVPWPARAANSYYVSPSGNDTNPGTLAQPFRTIATGVNKLAAGDMLYLRGGTYVERVQVSKSNITIAGYPGETAVIDGTGISGSGWVWMIDVTGNHDIFQDFEVQWPNGQGIWLEYSATYTTIHNLNVHNTYQVGINVWGNNTLIENSQVWDTNQSNYPAGSGGDWSAAISVGDQNPGHGGYGNNTTVRNNQVYQNYGEGIMYTYVDNGLIEGNTVWDNWAADIYLDQCSLTTIQRNLAYYTTNHTYFRDGSVPAAGIEFSNEGIISYPISHDVKIYNNIVVNAGVGITFWQGKVSGSALINDTIANNTIVSNFSYYESLAIDPPNGGSHSNSYIQNNLVSSPGVLASGYNSAGITWSNNLWSRNPGFTESGDVIGNPLLANATASVNAGIDPAWYKLTSGSPAIGKALVLSAVQTDYFGVSRDSSPDIGAAENKGAKGADGPTATSVSTPTSTKTLLPTATATVTSQPTSTPIASSTPTQTFTATATAIIPTSVPLASLTPTRTPTVYETPTTPQPTATPAPEATSIPIPACNGSISPCSLWGPGGTPSAPNQQYGAPIELGFKFRADVAGQILGVRFYRGSSFTGTHIAHLWAADGSLLAIGTFVNETSSGWQTVTFAEPVTIAADTTYIASYSSPDGWFNSSPAGLANAVDNPPLHALKDGADGLNGVEYSGGSGFPTLSWNSSNYWVDVIFSFSTKQSPTPIITPQASLTPTQTPVLTATSPAPQPTITPLASSTPTSMFTATAKPLPTNTPALPTNTPAASTPTPMFTPSATRTSTPAGAPTLAPSVTPKPTNTQTPLTVPVCNGSVSPCSIWGSGGKPSAPNQQNKAPIELGLRFRTDVAGKLLGVRFYKGSSFTGTHTAHLWSSSGKLLATATFVNETSSGWQNVTFAQPVAVAAGTTYVVSFYSPDGWFNSSPAGLANAVDSGPLHALMNKSTALNGIFHYGGSGFPTLSWNSSNYWVDVIFSIS